MGELERQADVAGRVDLLVGGLQEVVHPDAASVVLDPRRFEIETLYVGCSADADQDLVDGDPSRAIGSVERQHLAVR